MVEDLNPLVVSDPALALQLGLQAFPGILTGPEEVGGEGAGATANDLINRKGNVVGKPEDLQQEAALIGLGGCLLYTSPSPRDRQKSRMPSSA